jgi:4-hydroxy-2-oxoheptanedioate aldolase
MAELDAIASIEHLDSLVIGPYDLSLSMGVAVTDPRLFEAIERIVAVAKRAGLFVGIGMGAGDQAFAKRAIEMGVNWLQVGGDYSYMIHFADSLVASIRGGAAK